VKTQIPSIRGANLATLALLIWPLPASGLTTISATDVGWYHSTGHSRGSSLNNYLVGDSDENVSVNVRNFVVFDLSILTQPIQNATVHFFNGAEPPGYLSPDPSETYALFDVTTDLGVLVAGTGGVTAYDDLGGGAFFGSVEVSAADNGQFVEVDLNADGIAALNSANGLFAFGGDLTTISHPDSVDEALFRFSHATPDVRLVVETIPEPSILVLLGIVVVGWTIPRTAHTSGAN
jgi:hypothetical protein